MLSTKTCDRLLSVATRLHKWANRIRKFVKEQTPPELSRNENDRSQSEGA